MRVKKTEILYEIMLCLATLDAAIYSTIISEAIKEPLHLITLLSMIILIPLCIYEQKYTVKELFVSLGFFAFGLVSYFVSGNTDIMISLMIVILSNNIDINKILNLIFRVRLIVFFSTITMALFGILEMGKIANSSAEKGVLLGYGHANTFAGNVGILLFLLIAINRDRLNKRFFSMLIIVDALIFYLSRSRTFLVLLSLLIIILLFYKAKKISAKKIFKFTRLFLPIWVIFIFMLIFLKYRGLLTLLVNLMDKMMNGRILLAIMNLKYYPITVLGQNVDYSIIARENMYYALDNGFVYVLINYGVVGLLIIVGLAQKALLECIKKKQVILCLLCFLIMIWMAYEGMMVSATANFTLIFAMTLPYEKRDLLIEKDEVT